MSAINGKPYNFHASSLIDYDMNKGRNQIDDQYNLFHNYPNNYTMHRKSDDDSKTSKEDKASKDYKASNDDKMIENDGDLTSAKILLDIQKQMDDKKVAINVYTSDVGMQTDDYDQERAQFKCHIGQIISGLMMLQGGGLFIVKQYTYFSKKLLDVISLICPLFEKLWVCKPLSSRPTNSETYLVGFIKDKLQNQEMFKECIDKLFEYLNADDAQLDKLCSERKEVIDLYDSMSAIFEQQMNFIEHTLNMNKYGKIPDKRLYIRSWYHYNPIVKVEWRDDNKLNMSNLDHKKYVDKKDYSKY